MNEDALPVPVRISEGLAPMAASLADQLGADFDVAVEPPGANGIAVVAALGREAVAFMRAQHPRAVLLVVKRGPNGHNDSAVDYLHAGADQYLETTSTVEISSHIRSLGRRLHRASQRPDG
ncbi:MAG TPA: hypothetical protein VFV00_19495 [Acidimicrobiales bacterium]|nr:hypothetical protein [Acidimicrobiales bacterium]